jgi:hypothetical protein
MPEHQTVHVTFVDLTRRAARVAFTFLVMNCSAVVGVFAAVGRRKVWR